MVFSDFDRLVDYIVEQRIKKVMCAKSAEYSRGDDKLWNFKRAAEIDGITPEQALRGMDLKHRTSISDMLDTFNTIDTETATIFSKPIEYSREVWEEKLTDHINYTILLWGLLAERYGWKIE